MRFIPNNPEQNPAERRLTVRTRLAGFLGGAVLMTMGAEIGLHNDYWTTIAEQGRICVAIGFICIVGPALAELQERFSKKRPPNENGEDDTDGGGGGDWPPDNPTPITPPPYDPEFTIDFSDIEDYLAAQDNQLIGV